MPCRGPFASRATLFPSCRSDVPCLGMCHTIHAAHSAQHRMHFEGVTSQDLPVIRACDKDVEKFCVSDAAHKAKVAAAGRLAGKGKHGVLGHQAAVAPIGQVRPCDYDVSHVLQRPLTLGKLLTRASSGRCWDTKSRSSCRAG